MIHLTHPALATKRFDVALIGAGGNGSQMLTGLARLAHAMVALGHPGFHVCVYDPDTVSNANVGRQMFSPADVGLAKAAVLTHRVNAFFGLDWTSCTSVYNAHGLHADEALAVVCVDSRASRRAIADDWKRFGGPVYALDLGNRASDGQVLLGQVSENAKVFSTAKSLALPADHVALPHPYHLLPELIDTRAPEDDTPSCSLAEALERQELFVNDDVTRAALLILWNLLRRGRLEWHGAFVNSLTGRRSVVPVDPEVWARMRGGETKPKTKTKGKR